jgi:uncharacterized membrane protein YhiD involved in acid resistance
LSGFHTYAGVSLARSFVAGSIGERPQNSTRPVGMRTALIA